MSLHRRKLVKFETIAGGGNASYENFNAIQIYNKGVNDAGDDITITNSDNQTYLIPYGMTFNFPDDPEVYGQITITVPSNTVCQIAYY